jgi:hypothetical protein
LRMHHANTDTRRWQRTAMRSRVKGRA